MQTTPIHLHHQVYPISNFLQIELLWNGQLSFFFFFFQFKGFACFPCFLLIIWCVGLSFKFLELFHYSIVKVLQVLCLMASLKPPSIFKHKALFGFQLPIFPFKFVLLTLFSLNLLMHLFILLILTLLHYAMLLLHILMHILILLILTLLHQATLLK